VGSSEPRSRSRSRDVQREVLPGLQDVTIRRIVEATGLSLRHCARIRRGEVVSILATGRRSETSVKNGPMLPPDELRLEHNPLSCCALG
jgi:hypothetical protein